ncbi:ABC transporter ATP-binding protein [Saccharibacillus kuerlensis]|uniref:Dipeptide/oligopeptide/nickel ABC transporter ATP-binding protein n=1 Tax=Saccharibacillus kuerlensis TaxID=459527 RepID=A0ABQ2KUV4_9BACL|nr:dipeptide/oligopeptide/nickel ABC transporter ATP-binding protein [Saccharibacillus kuerlensis]GGN94086.1 dipeptide/oligopeptide/nickel ABC transporter ATP-binding protein [Saccharibacillus kuerlensis]
MKISDRLKRMSGSIRLRTPDIAPASVGRFLANTAVTSSTSGTESTSDAAASSTAETLDSPVLAVERLSRTYAGAERPAVDDVSFSIGRGECLGLVGESGCGKSTLARCLLRIEDADSGSIILGGQDIARLNGRKLRPHRRRIQIVFQNPTAALNPKLKVSDSLIDPYEQLGQDAKLTHFAYTSRDAYIRQLLEAVELPAELASRYPHELSGGQRQRVTIARAISIEPDVVVLDEPTASLDVISQGAVLDLLTNLRTSLGLSYLFISHDLAAVHRMSQRIMVMREGEIVDRFDAGDLFAEERHAYTKELISIF